MHESTRIATYVRHSLVHQLQKSWLTFFVPLRSRTLSINEGARGEEQPKSLANRPRSSFFTSARKGNERQARGEDSGIG